MRMAAANALGTGAKLKEQEQKPKRHTKYANTPGRQSVGATDVQAGPKLRKDRRWQSFGEDICILK